MAWITCTAESSFPFKTPNTTGGLASAKLHVSQISAIDRKLFMSADELLVYRFDFFLSSKSET